MKNRKLMIAFVVLCAMTWSCSAPRTVEPNYLTPPTPQSPAPEPQLIQRLDSTPVNRESLSNESDRPKKNPPTTCLDGSKLTIVGSDANQTNYKCGSGAIGAYTN
jgi:hypothetical protein